MPYDLTARQEVADRPRLLFLAFSFPPLRAISAVRAAAMAKYLGRSGWEVTVVTPDPALLQNADNAEQAVAHIDACGIKRICTGHRWRCLSSGHLKRSYHRGLRWFLGGICRRVAKMLDVDEMIGWYPEVERACARLKARDIDVVMATGSPFGAFKVAQRLSRRLKCPYVLDYRDLWTGNPHARGRKPDHHAHVERRLLADCAAVSVVSPSMARYLGDRFGVDHKAHVIPNGYDPIDFERIKPVAFGHFAIVYAGQFLPPKRTATPLMQTLRRVAELTPDASWRFHYYGPSGDHVREAATAFGVRSRVELHGEVPRRQCLEAIRGAGAAVVITSVLDAADIADRGIITGKIFEPIGLGTPVLLITPPQSDAATVIQTAGGGSAFVASNIEGMAAFLMDLMQGKVPASGQPGTYAWPSLVQKLDAMLQQIQR